MPPTDFHLTPQGTIPVWLVAERPPVSAAVPEEGDPWRFAFAADDAPLDLIRVLGERKNTRAGLDVTLVARRTTRVTLKFGTDDGGTLTLNGREIWAKTVTRGVRRDEESVAAVLRPGENRLRLDVDQGEGGWGAILRVVGRGDRAPEGVVARLRIAPTGGGPEAEAEALRAYVGKPGALDVDAALGWRARSATARRFARHFATSPSLTAALAARTSARDADAATRLLREANARLKRAYDRVRAPFLAAVQNPGPLFDVPTETFVDRWPEGRWFRKDGKPWLPVGYNHNPDWPELEQSNPDSDDYDPKRTDAWFARLAASGVDLVRLMVETPPSSNLEDPVGTIRPEHARWLDHVVTAARAHGVRLMITPYDTFWMSLRRETSSYFAPRGPISDPRQWYADPRLAAAQKRRMRWLIERYGNLDTVFCWEFLNEGDIWWDTGPEGIEPWARDMAAYVRQVQKERWGKSPLLSFSSANPMPDGALGEFIYRAPYLDLANTHLYIGASKAPDDPLDPGPTEVQGVRYALSQIRDRRPYLDTENGPIDRWIADEKLDDAVFRTQTWAHLMAGGVGSGLRWPYRGPHHLTPGMLAHLAAFREFVDAVDWSGLAGDLLPATLPEVAGTFAAGSVGQRGAVVYFDGLAGRRVSAQGFATARAFDPDARRWSDLPVEGGEFVVPASPRSAVWLR